MRKNIKRIAIVFILLTIILTICTRPSEAVIATLSASSANVKSGETFSVTITSSIKLSGWTILIYDDGGCTFSSASGGTVNGTSVYGTSLDGTTSLATYTFKAPTVTKDTTYTINFSGIDMCDATDDANIVSDTGFTATITVKANTTSNTGSGSSSGNTGSSGSSSSSSGSNTTTTQTPTFKSVNKTVYTTNSCNLRASWSTSSNATPVEKGTELKLTGTSTETINGYIWYRVTYNGATKYIASSLITETKPKEEEKEEEKSNNKNLSSLSIEGIELTPSFNKETTQYTAKVDGDVTELKIDAKAEDSKAKVTIEGNEGLKEGDNIIKIKVTAEDDTTRTYFITVTKGEGIITDNTLKLSELKIERVNFEENFNPDTYTYELSLNAYVDKLEIIATPNQADATVEIIGNSDFKTGKNIVTILLTSADGKQTATYQIQVNLPEELVEETSEPSMEIYIIIGVVIAVAIIAIFSFILRFRTTRKEELIEEEDSDSKLISRYTSDDAEKEEENSKRKKSDVTVDDFLNVPDENEEKTKKSKGRHSI